MIMVLLLDVLHCVVGPGTHLRLDEGFVLHVKLGCFGQRNWLGEFGPAVHRDLWGVGAEVRAGLPGIYAAEQTAEICLAHRVFRLLLHRSQIMIVVRIVTRGAWFGPSKS